MTSKEALEEIKNFKIVRLHESSLPEMTTPIAEHFAEQTSIIEKDLELLEQYKIIEDELGIDLITLLKALKNGIYYKNLDTIIEFVDDIEFSYGWYSDETTPKTYYLAGDMLYLFSNYSKTWALTKEELENDK